MQDDRNGAKQTPAWPVAEASWNYVKPTITVLFWFFWPLGAALINL